MEATRLVPLTTVQQKVYDLDLAGNTPSKIAEATGLSLARVSNVRKRLRDLGYKVIEWRQKRPANDNAVPIEPELAVFDLMDALKTALKKKEPARQFCRCGLTLPCNQCLDEIELGATCQPKDTGVRDLGAVGNGGFVAGRKIKSKGCE